MRNLISLFLVLLIGLFCVIAAVSPLRTLYAADGGETVITTDGRELDAESGEDVTPTPDSDKCNWDGFKNSLKGTESCGGQAAIVNSLGYAGLYQFGEGALASAGWYREGGGSSVDGNNGFEGSWTGPNAVNLGAATPTTRWGGTCGNPGGSGKLVSPVLQAFLNNPQAQEDAFYDWMEYMYKATKSCHNYIGTHQVQGYRWVGGVKKMSEPCTVTLSGILGAGHLCGQGICDVLRSGNDRDDAGKAKQNGTSCFHYMCKHGGYDVPFDDGTTAAACNPSSTGGGGDGTVGPGALSSAPPEEQRNEAASHYKTLNDLVDYLWIGALQLMTNTFSTLMMAQAQTIGQFLDAKHQLETKRLFQQKTAEAHKDYQPSEQMCTIGTFVRDLAPTERRMEYNEIALAEHGIQYSMANADSMTIEGATSNEMSRLDLFRETYCNPEDNTSGLEDLCEGASPSPDDANVNIDIDYTRLVDMPWSLELDFSDDEETADELNVIALMNNLFNHVPPPLVNNTTGIEFSQVYPELRSLMAIRSVARNSMNHIIAQKTSGTEVDSNAPFIKALLKEMGIEDDAEIERILGERPSYYAQMEVLTKTMYQNPNFITNLYDKPANVARLRSAMSAIKSMQDRDIYEALIRQEMLKSLITEMMLRKAQTTPYNRAAAASQD